MWNQDCSQFSHKSHNTPTTKTSAFQILPCTVSQLLSASDANNDYFANYDFELCQVSVVGTIQAFTPFVTSIHYSLDDRTGPPLTVKQWVNTQDGETMTFMSPGTYVKVIGNFRGHLLAKKICCIEDLNEITSHMLEVIQAHMQLRGKVFDVNMNKTFAPPSGKRNTGHPTDFIPNGLSKIQGQVFSVIRKSSATDAGIGFSDLQRELHCISLKDIRSSLAFLVNEGHIFSTIDEHHYKSTDL